MAFNPGMSCQRVTIVYAAIESKNQDITYFVDAIGFGLRRCHSAFDIVDKKRCKNNVN